jgi:hypothetical protein
MNCGAFEESFSLLKDAPALVLPPRLQAVGPGRAIAVLILVAFVLGLTIGSFPKA